MTSVLCCRLLLWQLRCSETYRERKIKSTYLQYGTRTGNYDYGNKSRLGKCKRRKKKWKVKKEENKNIQKNPEENVFNCKIKIRKKRNKKMLFTFV